MEDITDAADSELINEAIRNIPLDRHDEYKIKYLQQKQNHWITLLMCIFMGPIGAHKFYLQDPWAGYGYMGLFGARMVLFYYINMTRFEYYIHPKPTLEIIINIITYTLCLLILYDLLTFKKQTKEINKQIARKIVEEMNFSQNGKNKDIV